MNRLLFAPVAAIVCMAAPALAADKIDNPMYKMWASYKPGTYVTMKSETDMGGTKSTSTTTTKLIEVTADKLVLEMTMTSKVEVPGVDIPATTNTMKQDVPAKMDKPAEQKTDEKAPKPKEGEEELTVNGKKIKCKWIEMTMEQGGTKTVSKSWTSDEVPGKTVKTETKMDGTDKPITMVVTDFKIVK